MGYEPRQQTLPCPEQGLGIEWEETACLLCGGRRCTPFLEAPDNDPESGGLWFLISQCQDCGLCFTNPRPSPHSIEEFYHQGYDPHRTDLLDPTAALGRPWRSGGGRLQMSLHGQGRLLDFGCGNGTFLARMHAQGWKVTGLDLSQPSVDHIRSALGLHALVGTLPHAALEEEGFDLITMWQALEHVHQPLEVLREARRLLAPDGQLMVSVPNLDSLAFQWFGACWRGLDLPRHLVHFTPQTLRLMLHRAGLRPGPVRMVRRGGWLRASARIAAQHQQHTAWTSWLGRRPSSSLASWLGYLTGRADCMSVTAWKR